VGKNELNERVREKKLKTRKYERTNLVKLQTIINNVNIIRGDTFFAIRDFFHLHLVSPLKIVQLYFLTGFNYAT